MSDIDLFGSIYEKDDVIFEQDVPGDTMYIIQSGAVEISCRRGRETVVLALMQKGEVFGEMALIDNQARSARAKALSRTRLLPIRRDSFINRTIQDPSIIFQLLKSICHRIERTNSVLQSLVMSDRSFRSAVNSHLHPSPPQKEQKAEDQPLTECRQNDATPLVELLRTSDSNSLILGREPTLQQYQSGETVFNEGDTGEEMFIVVDGKVDIFTKADGQKILLNQLGEGEFFGEMALVTGNSRTATAVAARDTHLMSINNEQLVKKMSANPEMALFIIQVLISRLRAATIAIESPEQSMGIIRHIMSPVFKKKERVRIAVISLSSCGGCASILIQNQANLAAFMDVADVVYCPMLMDADSFNEVDIALVDGAVRVREDEELLVEARAKSKFLVAWGTCAAYGGIPSMANQFEIEELLEESYGETADPFSYYLSDSQERTNGINYSHTDLLLRKARKLDDIARVDYFLPGCPPKVSMLTDLIFELKGSQNMEKTRAIVCAECPRKPQKNKPSDMRAFPNNGISNNVCIVSQGVLCLGLITKGGCGAACLQGGMPCWGCRGPMQKVIGELSKGSLFEDIMMEIIARKTKLNVEKLLSAVRMLRQTGGSFFSFDQSFVKDASRLR